MTQVSLDQPQIHAGFEQMGRVTVPQGVNRNRLAEVQLSHHPAHCPVHAVVLHGTSGRGGCTLIASGSRKQPDRIAVRHPVLAQHGQSARRQWQVAIFGPLAEMHVHEHPLAVDVAHLQLQAFLEPQAQRVNGPEKGLGRGVRTASISRRTSSMVNTSGSVFSLGKRSF